MNDLKRGASPRGPYIPPRVQAVLASAVVWMDAVGGPAWDDEQRPEPLETNNLDVLQNVSAPFLISNSLSLEMFGYLEISGGVSDSNKKFMQKKRVSPCFFFFKILLSHPRKLQYIELRDFANCKTTVPPKDHSSNPGTSTIFNLLFLQPLHLLERRLQPAFSGRALDPKGRHQRGWCHLEVHPGASPAQCNLYDSYRSWCTDTMVLFQNRHSQFCHTVQWIVCSTHTPKGYPGFSSPRELQLNLRKPFALNFSFSLHSVSYN